MSMRYEIKDVPEGLPPGKHPTRIGKWKRDGEGKIIVPVTYAPWKRIEDSAVPLIVHNQSCQERGMPVGCLCHMIRLPQEYPITSEGRYS